LHSASTTCWFSSSYPFKFPPAPLPGGIER